MRFFDFSDASVYVWAGGFLQSWALDATIPIAKTFKRAILVVPLTWIHDKEMVQAACHTFTEDWLIRCIKERTILQPMKCEIWQAPKRMRAQPLPPLPATAPIDLVLDMQDLLATDRKRLHTDVEEPIEEQLPPPKKIESTQGPSAAGSSRYSSRSQDETLRLLPEMSADEAWTQLITRKGRSKFKPWNADVLACMPGALNVRLTTDRTLSFKQHQLFEVEVTFSDRSSAPYFLKVFSEYNSGWSEAVMVSKMEEINPLLAFGKLAPTCHGPCITSLDDHGRPASISYFALTRPSGCSVPSLSADVDLKWPLPELCHTILRFLLSFEASDPTNSPYKFYHGDSNRENYVIDIDHMEQNPRLPVLTMIDFGNAWFEWSPSPDSQTFISPRKTHTQHRFNRPLDAARDVETFYAVLGMLLQKQNSLLPRPLRDSLLDFCRSRTTPHPSTEVHLFKSWCHGHSLDLG